MAIQKPTTTADVKQNEQQVANAKQAEAVAELTDPAMVADVEQVKTVKVKSPLGAETEVPESLVEALLDSGYSKS